MALWGFGYIQHGPFILTFGGVVEHNGGGVTLLWFCYILFARAASSRQRTTSWAAHGNLKILKPLALRKPLNEASAITYQKTDVTAAIHNESPIETSALCTYKETFRTIVTHILTYPIPLSLPCSQHAHAKDKRQQSTSNGLVLEYKTFTLNMEINTISKANIPAKPTVHVIACGSSIALLLEFTRAGDSSSALVSSSCGLKYTLFPLYEL